jgi:hypothetical protein
VADRTTGAVVVAGDHTCLTFSDPEQRLDLLAAFVGEGLQAGDRVLCFTDSIPGAELPDQLTARAVRCEEALGCGQLAVTGSDRAWLAEGGNAAQRMIDLLVTELDRAAGDGYPGLRVTADMAWVTRPHAAAAELLRFESQVAGLFGDGRLTTICQYDREVFDPVTLAFAVEPRSTTRTRCCRSAASTGRPGSGSVVSWTTAGSSRCTSRCRRRCGSTTTSRSTCAGFATWTPPRPARSSRPRSASRTAGP